MPTYVGHHLVYVGCWGPYLVCPIPQGPLCTSRLTRKESPLNCVGLNRCSSREASSSLEPSVASGAANSSANSRTQKVSSALQALLRSPLESPFLPQANPGERRRSSDEWSSQGAKLRGSCAALNALHDSGSWGSFRESFRLEGGQRRSSDEALRQSC